MAKTIINLLVGSVGSKFTEWQNALALTFELETDVKDVSSALTEAETVKTSAADAINKAETAESSVKTNFTTKLSAIEAITDITNDTLNSIKTYTNKIKSFLNDNDSTLQTYKTARDAYFDFVAGISTTGNEDILKSAYDTAKSIYDAEIETFESDYNNLLVYFDEYNASIGGISYTDIVTAYSLYSRADSNVDNAISVERAAGVNVNNAITLKNDFENQLTSAKVKSFELEKEFENICPTYFEHVNNVNQSKIYSIKAETARIKKEIETINAETQDILYDLSKNQSTTQEEIIVAFNKLNTAVDSEVTLATNLQKDITNEAISVSFTETIQTALKKDIASEITDITALQTSVNTLRDTITDKGFNESLTSISTYNSTLLNLVDRINQTQLSFYNAINGISNNNNKIVATISGSCDPIEIYKDGTIVITKNNTTATPTFTSNDTTIATVDTDGKVIGNKVGKTTITASIAEDDHYTAATCTIDITIKEATTGILFNETWSDLVPTGFTTKDSTTYPHLADTGKGIVSNIYNNDGVEAAEGITAKDATNGTPVEGDKLQWNSIHNYWVIIKSTDATYSTLVKPYLTCIQDPNDSAKLIYVDSNDEDEAKQLVASTSYFGGKDGNFGGKAKWPLVNNSIDDNKSKKIGIDKNEDGLQDFNDNNELKFAETYDMDLNSSIYINLTNVKGGYQSIRLGKKSEAEGSLTTNSINITGSAKLTFEACPYNDNTNSKLSISLSNKNLTLTTISKDGTSIDNPDFKNGISISAGSTDKKFSTYVVNITGNGDTTLTFATTNNIASAGTGKVCLGNIKVEKV